ncbi:hypothetical protein PFMC_01719 [Plasmodium falciparum CAMP/Malaysia]|uniref:Duffy-binding-like domain-containing protein n=1 Tax=Plasmodium falciparum (isolate Camp / Malaysia) TaxID=5835 RepID=A0A024XB84_PLAFC|nr:hypothetical protein PFMC_01719 [Plasmodium falciparum CAMP/Malaysia]
MFYTLGDYRDILVRGGDVNSGSGSEKEGDSSSNNNIVGLASGSDKKSRDEMEVIQKQIEEYIKSLKQAASVPNPQRPGQQQQNSSLTRETLWDKIAEPIWNGMICALTYKEDTDSGPKGKPPTQDPTVKSALLDGEGKPKKEEYQYLTAKLEDESGAKPKPTEDTTQPPTLKQFPSRPTYFRYLEEWGENFCKERKKRLDQIYKECKVGQGRGNGKVCSGYGEDCETNLHHKYDILPSLECPDCGKYCSSYKKWIEKKKMEYEKQSNEFTKQKDKCIKESKDAKPNNNDNGFSATIENLSDAVAFLNSLKNGSCSKNDDESGKGKIDFKNEGEAFGHENYCDPCSEFKIDCEKGNCKGEEKNKCDGKKTIEAKEIENMKKNTKEVTMLVSDKSKNESQNGLEDCISSGIFKGIKENKWTCGNVCGYEVCIPENGNGRENQNKIITIRGLVAHWVQNFLEDYNKIKHKISQCMKNGNGSKCTNDCPNKCNCATEWIGKKRAEWETIRGRFNEQYKDDPDYNVKSVLETLQPQTDVKKATGREKISDFESSCHCNGAANSEKENGKKRDVVVCLIEKLEKEAKKCEENHKPSGEETETACQTPNTLPDDEDLLLEEENENHVKAPKICPPVEEKKETVVEEEKCEAAAPPPKETAPPSEETNQNPEEKPEAKPPAQAPDVAPPAPPAAPRPPRRQTPQIVENPLLRPALATSPLAWSVGIGFAAFTYFYLKVNGSIYIKK